MIDPKIIDDLKAKHPGAKLHRLAHSGAEIIVKPPGEAEYRKFKAKTKNDRLVAAAGEGLIYDCLVFPEAAVLATMIGERPGLVDTFTNALVDLAGLAKECEEVVPL